MSENEPVVTRSHEQPSDADHEVFARERHEVLREQLERAERQHNTNRTSEQDALREATELAADAKVVPETEARTSPAERRRGAPSKKQREASLKSQLSHIQSEMDTSSRIISKVIHSKPIESLSDTTAATVARPNALLSGSIAAFIGVTVCYFVAKYYGYQLSGFETIAAFIFGWIIGILYDYFSVMIRGSSKDR